MNDHGWLAFFAWVVIGAVSALGLVVLGAPMIVLIVALVAVVARVPAMRRSTPGLLTGAGFPLLLIAYAQRDGPGITCHSTSSGGSCTEHLNPVPWLIAGILLVVAGVVCHVWRGAVRRGQEHELSV